PGVQGVAPIVIVPFQYGEDIQATQPSFATDPATIFTDPRFVVPPEQQKAWRETRTGLIAGRALAQKYGWKVGDHITLRTSAGGQLFLRRKDGGDRWEFDVVGLFDYNEDIMGKGISAMRVFVRYDYIDEARADPGTADLFFIWVKDAAQAPAVIKAV